MKDDPLFDDQVIDINPRPRKRRRWLIVLAAIIIFLFLTGSRLTSIYVDSLWFSSVGYSNIYWYKFRLGGMLFLFFFVVTFLIIRLPFVFLSRFFPELTERPRLRPVSVEEIREINFLPFFYRPGVWLFAIAGGLLAAINMSREWPEFALYLNSQHAGASDPIFNRDVGFYLFKLPVLELLTGWIQTIAVLLFIVVAAISGYIWYLERIRGT